MEDKKEIIRIGYTDITNQLVLLRPVSILVLIPHQGFMQHLGEIWQTTLPLHIKVSDISWKFEQNVPKRSLVEILSAGADLVETIGISELMSTGVIKFESTHQTKKKILSPHLIEGFRISIGQYLKDNQVEVDIFQGNLTEAIRKCIVSNLLMSKSKPRGYVAIPMGLAFWLNLILTWRFGGFNWILTKEDDKLIKANLRRFVGKSLL